MTPPLFLGIEPPTASAFGDVVRGRPSGEPSSCVWAIPAQAFSWSICRSVKVSDLKNVAESLPQIRMTQVWDASQGWGKQ